jgi:RNA polymerase sigma-70 factor (ECF subfamily)
MDASEAVRQAYQAHYSRLVGQLYGVTGDLAEAEDVVHEAFARALLRPARFLDVQDPAAWLRTVAVNLAKTRYRRRWLFDQLQRAGRVWQPPDAVPGLSPDRVALVAALRRLPYATRVTLVLHHVADLPVDEVAAILGVPAGTVKARLSRGRAALARHLSDEPTPAVGDAGSRRPPAGDPGSSEKEALRHA